MLNKLISSAMVISFSLISLTASAEVAKQYSCVNEAHTKLSYFAAISNEKVVIQFAKGSEKVFGADVKTKRVTLAFETNSNGWSSYQGQIVVQPELRRIRNLEARLEPKDLGLSKAFKMHLSYGREHGENDISNGISTYGMICTLKK